MTKMSDISKKQSNFLFISFINNFLVADCESGKTAVLGHRAPGVRVGRARGREHEHVLGAVVQIERHDVGPRGFADCRDDFGAQRREVCFRARDVGKMPVNPEFVFLREHVRLFLFCLHVRFPGCVASTGTEKSREGILTTFCRGIKPLLPPAALSCPAGYKIVCFGAVRLIRVGRRN